jgi:hypothetical protein
MHATTESAAVSDMAWTAVKGRADELHGLWGKFRLVADGTTVGLLNVEDGEVRIDPHGEASNVLATDTLATLLALLGGELHPVVARLQGRAWIEGDSGLGLRILLGLRAGSPWRGLSTES